MNEAMTVDRVTGPRSLADLYRPMKTGDPWGRGATSHASRSLADLVQRDTLVSYAGSLAASLVVAGLVAGLGMKRPTLGLGLASAGAGIVLLPLVALATRRALSGEASRDVNLGIAVATDYGLIVPVVRGAEALTVVGLARAIRDLASKARDKKLNPDDVGGSTFSITNPGPFGSYVSLPVINQPNVAILSTELVEKRVVDVEDMIAIRHRTFLSMSWDHRLLDGADAMRFLATLKENLETWDFTHDLT
jgi:hypothetical protein